MAIIAAITSLADILPASGSTEQTSASFKSTDTKEGIGRAVSGGTDLGFDLPSKLTDFWIGADVYPRSTGSGVTWDWISFYDATYSRTQALFKIVPRTSGGNTYRVQMWDGATYGDITPDFTFSILQLHRIDINIKLADTGGVIQFWDNGTLLATNTIGDTLIAGVTGIDHVELGGFGLGTQPTVWSRIIVADEDTRAMQMVQVLPTGNGSNTGWSGSYTDVDETGYNDGDVTTATAPGQNESYTHGALPVAYASGYEVKAVVLAGRMSKGQGHSMDIKGLWRIGGTNYIGASFGAGIAAAGKQIIYPLNPATGLPWTYAEAASEFGVACV